MTSAEVHAGDAEFAAEDCWRTIGVWGDIQPRCPLLDEVIHCRNCEVFVAAGRALLDRPAPSGYLDEWATSLARVPEPTPRDHLSLLAFRLGDEALAIATQVCREVTSVPLVRLIPHRSDPVVRGLVNVRGELLICVSMLSLLSIESAPTAASVAATTPIYRRLVVLEHRQRRWAFAADEVYGVVRVSAGSVTAAPATIGRDRFAYTTGMVVAEKRDLAILDYDRVFAALAKEDRMIGARVRRRRCIMRAR